MFLINFVDFLGNFVEFSVEIGVILVKWGEMVECPTNLDTN